MHKPPTTLNITRVKQLREPVLGVPADVLEKTTAVSLAALPDVSARAQAEKLDAAWLTAFGGDVSLGLGRRDALPGHQWAKAGVALKLHNLYGTMPAGSSKSTYLDSLKTAIARSVVAVPFGRSDVADELPTRPVKRAARSR